MKSITSNIILVISILIIFGIVIYNSYFIEKMTNIYESVFLPGECYNYLLYDNKNYYLINTRQMYDGVTNPRKFSTLSEANKYLFMTRCPPVPLINLVVHKDIEDPIDSFEKQCAVEVATKQYVDDSCITYGNEEVNNINNINSRTDDDYNIEKCMIKKAMNNNSKFMNDYPDLVTYFNKLNDNIDSKYLYLNDSNN